MPSPRDVPAQVATRDFSEGCPRRERTWAAWERCGTCGTQSSASAQHSAEPLRCCRSPGCPPTATGHSPLFKVPCQCCPGPGLSPVSSPLSPASKLQSRSSKGLQPVSGQPAVSLQPSPAQVPARLPARLPAFPPSAPRYAAVHSCTLLPAHLPCTLPPVRLPAAYLYLTKLSPQHPSRIPSSALFWSTPSAIINTSQTYQPSPPRSLSPSPPRRKSSSTPVTRFTVLWFLFYFPFQGISNRSFYYHLTLDC